MRPFDEKKWGMTYGELQAGLRRYGADLSWCHKNDSKLRKKYPDHWIVVEDKKVILADRDHSRVLKKLWARPGGIGNACIYFVSSIEYDLVI